MFGRRLGAKPLSLNLLSFLVISLIWFLCLLIMVACEKNSTAGYPLNRLPSFKCRDIQGKEVDFGKLKSKYVYLHFVRTFSPDDEIGINKICKDLGRYHSATLLFLFPSNSRPKTLESGPNIDFIYDKDGQISSRFNAPACCDSYQFFNQKGELIYRGLFDGDSPDQVISLFLDVIAGNIQYLDENFKQLKIKDSGLMADLAQFINHEANRNTFFVIGFISAGCVNCRIAEIIDRVNQIYASSHSRSCFLLEVPSDYSDADLINFDRAFQISIPIARPPQDIGLAWDYLRNHYAGLFDNFFIIINTKGEILDFLDEGGNEDSFFEYLISLVG